MNKNAPKNFIEMLINCELEKTAKDMKIEECSKFIQNCAKKYNIKYNTAKGLHQLSYFGEIGLFIHYLSDIEFIIVKRFLEKKNNKEFSDDEVYEYILNLQSSFPNKFIYFPVDILKIEDKSRIYEDFNKIINLYKRNAFKHLDQKKVELAIQEMGKYNIRTFANRKSCIDNLKTNKELNELGLQEYVIEQVPSILKRQTAEERQENMFSQLNIPMSESDKYGFNKR